MLLPIKDQTAQGVGSALTYAKRYAISSILGITADDDDDGELASKPVVQKPIIKAEAPKVKPEKAPEDTKGLRINHLEILTSMMWSDDINDAHVIEFLIANKMPDVTRKTLIADLPEKVIERLISKWNAVKAFKPAL